MRLASSARWGEPKVRRTGDTDLSWSRDLSSNGVTCKSLAGAVVTFLTAFGHEINTPTTVRFNTAPNIPSSSYHAYGSTAVARFLFAGHSLCRVSKELMKLCGASLQAL